MNLLRNWFLDRRKARLEAEHDRRKAKAGLRGWKESGDKLDHAVDNLMETISMSADDFRAMLRREAGPEIHEVVRFDTFAAICEYRYQPKDSVMTVCKHTEHEAASTGIAPCAAGKCPRMPK